MPLPTLPSVSSSASRPWPQPADPYPYFAQVQRSSLRIRIRRCREAQRSTHDPAVRRVYADRVADYQRQLMQGPSD